MVERGRWCGPGNTSCLHCSPKALVTATELLSFENCVSVERWHLLKALSWYGFLLVYFLEVAGDIDRKIAF